MFISLSHLQPHSCYWGQPKKRELFWGLGGDCAKKNSPGLLFFFSSALLSPLIYFPVALGCSKNRAVQNTIVPSGTVQSIRLGILYYNKVNQEDQILILIKIFIIKHQILVELKKKHKGVKNGPNL